MSTRLSAFATLTLILATAPTLQAQIPVQIRCEVADGSAAGCYYCPGFQSVIKFVGTRLQSTTVNLNLFQNQYVLLNGTWNGTVVTVTTAQITPESFSIGGGGVIGGQFHFTTHGTANDLALNLAALGAAFSVPFADLALQLDPASTVALGFGALDGSGEFQTNVDIPNVPSLVGLRVFGQGLILPQSGPFYTTNVDAKEVS